MRCGDLLFIFSFLYFVNTYFVCAIVQCWGQETFILLDFVGY